MATSIPSSQPLLHDADNADVGIDDELPRLTFSETALRLWSSPTSTSLISPYCQSLLLSITTSFLLVLVYVPITCIVIDGQSFANSLIHGMPTCSGFCFFSIAFMALLQAVQSNLFAYLPFVYSFKLEPKCLSAAALPSLSLSKGSSPWFPTRHRVVVALFLIVFVYVLVDYQAYPMSELYKMYLRLIAVFARSVGPLILFPLLFSSTPVRNDQFRSFSMSIAEQSNSVDLNGYAVNTSISADDRIFIDTPGWCLSHLPNKLVGKPASAAYLLAVLICSIYLGLLIPVFIDPDLVSTLQFWALSTICIGAVTATVMAMTEPLTHCHMGYTSLFSWLIIYFPLNIAMLVIILYPYYWSTTTNNRYLIIIGFYVICSVTNYVCRILAYRALPHSTSVAFMYILQFLEDVLSDLAFIDISPLSFYYWNIALLAMVKSALRDLDVVSYLLSYIQDWFLRRWRCDGNTPGFNRAVQWRQEFNRVLYRHQNFISETAAKASVITALTLDTLIIGEKHTCALSNKGDCNVDNFRTDFWIAAFTAGQSQQHRIMLIIAYFVQWLLQVVSHVFVLYLLYRLEKYLLQMDVKRLRSEVGAVATSGQLDVIELRSRVATAVNDSALIKANIDEYWLYHLPVFMVANAVGFAIALTAIAQAQYAVLY